MARLNCPQAALSMVCWLRGSVPSLEQPRGSVLMAQPVMQAWIHLLGSRKETMHQRDFDLGRFGAPTQKPIHLYCPVVMDLQVPLGNHQRDTSQPPTAIVYGSQSTTVKL